MRYPQVLIRMLLALAIVLGLTDAFTPLQSPRRRMVTTTTRTAAEPKNEEPSTAATVGVVELGDDNDNDENGSETGDVSKAVRSGPLFISQGEVDPDSLNPDFSDAKQTRVVIYTILSLLPVLFLIPFMLGRDFVPVDSLPPVDLTH